MLAAKLHKNTRPWLGTGSHLVPIAEWRVANLHIKRWISTLNRYNSSRPNSTINWISLVRVPDSTRVVLSPRWSDTVFGEISPAPLREQWMTRERVLKFWERHAAESAPTPEYIRRIWSNNWGDGSHDVCEPELVLLEPLGAASVLWTKDVRKLFSKPRGRCRNRGSSDVEA